MGKRKKKKKHKRTWGGGRELRGWKCVILPPPFRAIVFFANGNRWHGFHVFLANVIVSLRRMNDEPLKFIRTEQQTSHHKIPQVLKMSPNKHSKLAVNKVLHAPSAFLRHKMTRTNILFSFYFFDS